MIAQYNNATLWLSTRKLQFQLNFDEYIQIFQVFIGYCLCTLGFRELFMPHQKPIHLIDSVIFQFTCHLVQGNNILK